MNLCVSSRRIKRLPLPEKYNYLNPKKKAESVPSEYVKEILMKGTGFVGGKRQGV